MELIACPKCGGRTIKVTSLQSEDHILCQGCQHDWAHTPTPAMPPSGKSSDRRTAERRRPGRLVSPERCRKCPSVAGLVVETRTENFVYYRCPDCQDLFALRKPEGPIQLPSSAEIQREVELWRLRKGTRELRCIAGYLPTGIKLGMMEGEELRRAEVFQEAPELEQCAQLWRRKLKDRGWT
jgi:hypothetical protein